MLATLLSHYTILLIYSHVLGKYRLKHRHIMLAWMSVCVCVFVVHNIHDAVPTRSSIWGLRATTTTTASTLCHVWYRLLIFPGSARRKGSQAFLHDNNVDNGIHLRMVQVSWFLWSHFFLLVFFFFLFSVDIIYKYIIIIMRMYQQFYVFIFWWLSAMLTWMSCCCYCRCCDILYFIFRWLLLLYPEDVSPCDLYLHFSLSFSSLCAIHVLVKAHVLTFVVVGVVKHYIKYISRISSLSSHFSRTNG